VKFGDVVFEIWELTDRHIDTLIAILRTPSGVEVKRFCDTEPPAQSTMISSGGLLGCSAGADHILLKAARCHNPPPAFPSRDFCAKVVGTTSSEGFSSLCDDVTRIGAFPQNL